MSTKHLISGGTGDILVCWCRFGPLCADSNAMHLGAKAVLKRLGHCARRGYPERCGTAPWDDCDHGSDLQHATQGQD